MLGRPEHRGTIAKRLGELERDGLAFSSDAHTRPTDTGHQARVYKLTDQGRSAVIHAGGPEALEEEIAR